MRAFPGLVLLLLAAVPARAQDMPLTQILIPGEGWRLMSEAFKDPTALASDYAGNVYVADSKRRQLFRVDGSKRVTLFAKTISPVVGMAFGPDGRLYTAQPDK